MNIHYFQHDSHEGIYKIEDWAFQKGFPVYSTKFFSYWDKPDIDKIDFLIIMGGPMGVYDDNIYPWLKDEKKMIESAIRKNKKVMGICLGAQLIADVLGSKVYKNKEKEVGWFPVFSSGSGMPQTILKDFPDTINVLHWHNDTFDLPADAVHFAYSKACYNQGFLFSDRVLALQFHIETTLESVLKFTMNFEEDIKEKGKFIQTKDQIILKAEDYGINCNHHLFKILDNIAAL